MRFLFVRHVVCLKQKISKTIQSTKKIFEESYDEI